MTEERRMYGPPGTGKTTWLAKSATACAKKYGGDQVSLCSLTNTAVKEVVGRDIPIPSENIATLHARCKRALFAGSPAEEDVLNFIQANKAWASSTGNTPCLPSSMVRQIKDKTGVAEGLLSGNKISLFEQAQILRQQLIPRDRWPVPVRKFSDVWEGWCKETGQMDFTGWLEAAMTGGVLPHQKVVFVDEAQDHTPLQLAVIRSWDADVIFLIGDDDQCLYEWSGSMPQAFFEDTPNLVDEKVLSQSYRVPRAVHKVANRLASKIRRRKDKQYEPRDEEGSVTQLDYTIDDAAYSGILPDGLLENDDETYMIIASCGYMLTPIVDLLKEKLIPFHNPYRPGAAKWNPLRAFMKCMEAFDIKDRLWSGAEAAQWASILKSRGVFKPRMRQRFIDLCTSLNDELLLPRDVTKYFLPEWGEMALNRDIRLLRDGRSASGSFDWEYAWETYKTGDYDPRIIIGTIHSVKGGEADNVFIFPDLSVAGLNDYIGSFSDRVHRLFYVGVTRARKNLFLCAQNDPYRSIRW